MDKHGRPHRLTRHRESQPGSARAKTPNMHGNISRGNRESLSLPARFESPAGRMGKSKDTRS